MFNNGEANIEKERWSSSFRTVKYVDLTNDGKEDALVELAETSVGGSSYTSFHYNIYTIRAGKPRLIYSFSTGSESSCGHKQIQINDKKIFLEVFGICSLDDMSSENYFSDITADNITRFTIAWNGRRFIQENREVLPFPEKNVRKYLYEGTLKDND